MIKQIAVSIASLFFSGAIFADYAVKHPLPEIKIIDQVSPDDITQFYSYSCADTHGNLTFDFTRSHWYMGQQELQNGIDVMRNDLANPTYGTGKWPCQTKVIHKIEFLHATGESSTTPLPASCNNVINDAGFNLDHPITITITQQGCRVG